MGARGRWDFWRLRLACRWSSRRWRRVREGAGFWVLGAGSWGVPSLWVSSVVGEGTRAGLESAPTGVWARSRCAKSSSSKGGVCRFTAEGEPPLCVSPPPGERLEASLGVGEESPLWVSSVVGEGTRAGLKPAPTDGWSVGARSEVSGWVGGLGSVPRSWSQSQWLSRGAVL